MEYCNNKLVARQAILDCNKNTYGYELLYRDSLENAFNHSNPEQATSQVIFQNHVLGDLTHLCCNKKAFINFDERSLLSELPFMLDKNTIVVELLETINVTPDVIHVVSSLYNKGYILALDDYDFSLKWQPLFPYISIIKVDVENISFEQIAILKNSPFVVERNIKLVAERIETNEQFLALTEIGVDYFQGYFFHKPEIKAGYYIEPIKLNLLGLFTEACMPCMDFNTVAQIISQDVSLVNGTLKLVNMEVEQNRVEITCIKQAITFLGSDKIKQFIAIIAMSNLSTNGANELLTESLVRGKMMECIAQTPAFSKIKEVAFITGMMSHIDAILNCPLEKIIMELPLAKNIKDALIYKEGLLSEALDIATYFECSEAQGDISSIMIKHDISEDALLEDYHDSLKWCLTVCP
jgi:EAL and modified HD-GYP domain-containing signal transduction protein